MKIPAPVWRTIITFLTCVYLARAEEKKERSSEEGEALDGCPVNCSCEVEDDTLDPKEWLYIARCLGAYYAPRFSVSYSWVEIDLSGNDIKKLPTNAFGPLMVYSLILGDNQLRKLEPGAFSRTISMERLDLSNNHLTVIGQDWFQGLGELRSLQLSNNRISYVDALAFTSIPRLEELAMDGNLLTGIPTSALRPLMGLSALLLNRNSILDIPSYAFRGLRLETLDLSNNKAPLQLQPRSFCGLEPVYQGQNISHQMHSLKVLGLANNGIRSISPCGYNIHTAYFIGLEGNPLHCDCSLLHLRDIGTSSKKGLQTATCSSPPELHGRRVIDLDKQKLRCDWVHLLEQHNCVNPEEFCRQTHYNPIPNSDSYNTGGSYHTVSEMISLLLGLTLVTILR